MTICAFFAGIGFHQTRLPGTTADTLIGLYRPEFVLSDIDGHIRRLSEWDGDVIVLNFWAGWCPPCLEELPLLAKLQAGYEDQSLQVIGLSMDNATKAKEYIQKININYPILVGKAKVLQIVQQYGNQRGVLPYTVIVDRDGRLVEQIFGVVDLEKLRQIITPLLQGM